MALSHTASISDSQEQALAELSSNRVSNQAGNASAVSWGAILAGAAAAAVLSLILLLLGAGLGLSSISPWAGKGVSAGAFGISTIVWLTVTQILASGMGGYLAGRLRTRWAGVQADEVYFRDTAHGFLAWTVATLAAVSILTSAIGGIVSSAASLTGGVAATATVAGAAATKGDQPGNALESATEQFGYYVDSLFRQSSISESTTGTSGSESNSPQAIPTVEVTRIFINSMGSQSLPAADVTYIGQLVANNTGLSQQEAEQRVTEIYSSLQKKKADAELAIKQAAEKTRKATIYATLWLFVSLLIGAFSASLAATWGGRCRDAN